MASPAKSSISPSLQPELDALLKRIQDIERNVEAREKRLEDNKGEFEAYQCKKAEEFHAWQMAEKEKLFSQQEDFKSSQIEQRHRLMWDKEALSMEKDAFEKCQKRAAEISDHQEPITLEIGGDKFRTEKRTLARCMGSIFPELMERLQHRSSDGKCPLIFIDRDGKHFKFILNFIRQGDQVMRSSKMRDVDKFILGEILDEVQYYRIDRLECLIKRKLASISKSKVDCKVLENAKYLQKCSPNKEWKLVTTQNVLIKDSNLDGIIFQQVAFQHPITFENCILTNARFISCSFFSAINFTNVDLGSARFEHCLPVNYPEHFYFNNTDRSEVIFSPPLGEK